jgi:hypothetical protein
MAARLPRMLLRRPAAVQCTLAEAEYCGYRVRMMKKTRGLLWHFSTKSAKYKSYGLVTRQVVRIRSSFMFNDAANVSTAALGCTTLPPGNDQQRHNCNVLAYLFCSQAAQFLLRALQQWLATIADMRHCRQQGGELNTGTADFERSAGRFAEGLEARAADVAWDKYSMAKCIRRQQAKCNNARYICCARVGWVRSRMPHKNRFTQDANKRMA